jgi:hypothetical protein
MNETRPLTDLSVTELRKVLQIKEEIATLEAELKEVLGSPSSPAVAKAVSRVIATPARKRGGRRKLSPEARERIAAAQRARWAAQKNGKAASKRAVTAKPAAATKPAVVKRGGRRKLSPEARERIAAAQRARWAAQRGVALAKPEAAAKPSTVKRGGRRQLSPEARERIAAAQRARWAAARKVK